jgi:hypothetical protein
MIVKFGSGSQLIPVLDRPLLKTPIEFSNIIFPGSSKKYKYWERTIACQELDHDSAFQSSSFIGASKLSDHRFDRVTYGGFCSAIIASRALSPIEGLIANRHHTQRCSVESDESTIVENFFLLKPFLKLPKKTPNELGGPRRRFCNLRAVP